MCFSSVRRKANVKTTIRPWIELQRGTSAGAPRFQSGRGHCFPGAATTAWRRCPAVTPVPRSHACAASLQCRSAPGPAARLTQALEYLQSRPPTSCFRAPANSDTDRSLPLAKVAILRRGTVVANCFWGGKPVASPQVHRLARDTIWNAKAGDER